MTTGRWNWKTTASVAATWAAWVLLLTIFLAGGQRPTAPKAITDVVGIGWLDTLSVIVRVSPTIDTVSEMEQRQHILGRELPDSMAVLLIPHRRRQWLQVTPSPNGVTTQVLETVTPIGADEMRGIAAHEFGHVLADADRPSYLHFRALGPLPNIAGFSGNDVGGQMQAEAFADAFALSVCRRAPLCVRAPYPYFLAITTAEQLSFVDSLVGQLWGAL